MMFKLFCPDETTKWRKELSRRRCVQAAAGQVPHLGRRSAAAAAAAAGMQAIPPPALPGRARPMSHALRLRRITAAADRDMRGVPDQADAPATDPLLRHCRQQPEHRLCDIDSRTSAGLWLEGSVPPCHLTRRF